MTTAESRQSSPKARAPTLARKIAPRQSGRKSSKDGRVTGPAITTSVTAASCNRCHKVKETGAGEAGPNLAEIGKQPRDYILESVLFPNRKIAQGFDTFDIETAEGDRVIGVLKEDKPDALVVVTAENKRVTIKKSDIVARRKTLSAMLEGEMSAHLGYEPYEAKGRNSGNSRNGKRQRTVKTSSGQVAVSVPRDRP